MVIRWENWNSEWEIPSGFTYGRSGRLCIYSLSQQNDGVQGSSVMCQSGAMLANWLESWPGERHREE